MCEVCILEGGGARSHTCQRLTSGLFLHYAPLYLLRQVLSLNPEYTVSASLSRHLVLGILCLYLLSAQITDSHYTCLAFAWILGISTLGLMFAQQVPCLWAISPALLLPFFSCEIYYLKFHAWPSFQGNQTKWSWLNLESYKAHVVSSWQKDMWSHCLTSVMRQALLQWMWQFPKLKTSSFRASAAMR